MDQANAEDLQESNRPNILIMMVDDLGFSDLGCYGSEIDTPHLDQLAANGLKFSQFYNTAKCHSSRVSLLTGQYCLAAGDTALSHGVTTAEVLSQSGYFTAMTGKWHLKKEPTDFGFQRYFGHLSGACNYFSGDQTFRLNGVPWQVPQDNFYTTVANTDFALRFLDEARKEKKPWYLYVAFNAPHAPLHALPDDYAKYEDRYHSGWDEVREARFSKQKEIGILPGNVIASPRPEHVPAWEKLQPWRKQHESKKMSTLAAMIDRVDQEVGRLITDLKNHQELKNTLILFVSDNGACPYDRKSPKLDIRPTTANESLGDTTGWAWARNTPFRYYKQNQFEGGITTPAILHWPNGIKIKPGTVVKEAAHLIDVLPTLAEVTNSEIPNTWESRDLRPVSGQSLAPLLNGENFQRNDPLHFLFASDRGLRQEDWKIVSFRQGPWELYNLSDDRTERENLANRYPDQLNRMVKTWKQMSQDILHAPERSYSEVSSEIKPHFHREWTQFDGDTPEGPAVKTGKRGNNNNVRGRIRARKNTKVQIEGKVLQLTFTGDDPGIAIDLRGAQIPKGPYEVRFRLQQHGKTTGEIFFTTNREEILPKGHRAQFAMQDSNEWQWIEIPLETSDTIYQLRIDVSEGVGNASMAELQLLGSKGEIILAWPRN